MTKNNKPQAQIATPSKAIEDKRASGDNSLMFATVNDAQAFFKGWQADDVVSLDKARAAVVFCMTHYGYNPSAPECTAQPLTHAYMAFEHRGKGGLGSKLKAWVKAVSGYTWNATSNAFKMKKGVTHAEMINKGINKEILAVPFDQFVAKAVKKEFDAQSALAAIVRKCEREGMTKEEIAKVVSNFTTGSAPKLIKAPANVVKAVQGSIVNSNALPVTQQTPEQIEAAPEAVAA